MDLKLLLPHRHEFIAFARSRMSGGNADVAADLVQDCLLKAMQSKNPPKETAGALPWFYRILRRAIIDAYRRQQTRDKMMHHLQVELTQSVQESNADSDSSGQKTPCRCVLKLVKKLPVEEASLLQTIDMEGGSATELALRLGQRVNTLNVRLYRVRRKLRKKLVSTCEGCCGNVTGSMDCQCAA